MWPFHTWLPDAHTEAPTIGSVLLAGDHAEDGHVRLHPDRAADPADGGARRYAPWIGLPGGDRRSSTRALACLAQKDLKRLIAFSSVGHMGFVMLGIATLTTIGINAAIFGMVAHGVITGMLFFCVGSIYDRYHTREIAEIGGGMSQQMPKLAGIFAFVRDRVARAAGPRRVLGRGHGAALVVQPERRARACRRRPVPRRSWIVGGIGTILTAGYFLWMLQRVNMGTMPERWKEHAFRDVLTVEWVAWVPLLVAIVVLGSDPRLIFGVTDEAVGVDRARAGSDRRR
mgnify:CR=1 FL=1